MELADKLNVGRSTIREAVKALASRNILKIRQGSGTFISSDMGIVKDPLGLSLISNDINLAFDMINVRLIFEPEMAALAAINATDDDCAAIDKACSAVEKLINSNTEYSKEDSRFHEAVARASGNKVIDRINKVINSSIQKNIFGPDILTLHATEYGEKRQSTIYCRFEIKKNYLFFSDRMAEKFEGDFYSMVADQKGTVCLSKIPFQQFSPEVKEKL